MSGSKKIVSTLVLLLLVYVWYFFSYSNSHPQQVIVPPAETNLQLFIEPEAGRAPIIDAIKNAQKEILVEMYLLSDKYVIESLIESRAKGIAVDVMLEEHPFGGGNINTKTKAELESHDIAFKWTNSDFALTHEKAIVIDSSTALILTQNLTTSSFDKNREYNLINKDPKDVMEIKNIFISDWERKDHTPTTDTHLVISPSFSRPAITSLINSAAHEIDIEIESFNDKGIASLLKSVAKNVNIKLIIPPLKEINSNSEVARDLLNSGISVKTLSSPYVHAKLILVDNSKAYVGSINLSAQSMDENREVGMILTQKDIIDSLQSSFSKDWENAKMYP